MVHRRARTVLLCGLVCTLVACTAPDGTQSEPSGSPTSTDTGPPRPGGAGMGDGYYPKDGNGGYDVTSYDVTVSFDPKTGRLEGDTVIQAKATHDLSRFNLDLQGFKVNSVNVDGKPAKFTREQPKELVITPRNAVRQDGTMRVRVRYDGRPTTAKNGQLGHDGWQRTSSGGAVVLGEPHSASYWYPVNEHPRDKATFVLTARVPEGWETMSIGRRESESSRNGWTTTRWVEPDPVASYLTTLAVDHFTVERAGTTADGVPVLNAFGPGAEQIRPDAARTAEIIDFLAGKFGPYPFRAAGGIYLGDAIGYSLETQGRPTYTLAPGLSTIVHELAHQWFGNAVSIRSWADICLNECLASYSQWLWDEGKEGADLDARYRTAIENYREVPEFWAEKLYDMGSGNEFGGVYSKGLLAFHALRALIGDRAFNRVLREWPEKHSGGNASWPEFEAFVIETAGMDRQRLEPFFQAWFHDTKIPAEEHLFPGRLSS